MKKTLSDKNKARLFQTLTVIYRTGIDAAITLYEQYKIENNHVFKGLLFRLSNGITRGRQISKLIEYEIKTFDKTIISIIIAAEHTGHLPLTFEGLANYYDKLWKYKAKIRKSLFYPVGLFIAASIISASPDLFRNKIPEFIFKAFFPIVLLLVIVLIAKHIFLSIRTKSATSKKYAKFINSVPIIGDILQSLDLYKFSATMSLLQRAGESIYKSLKLSAASMNNYLLKLEIHRVSIRIEKEGLTLTQALFESRYLGNLLKQMISVGEVSGTLENSLIKFAGYTYEDMLFKTEMFRKLMIFIAYSIAILFVIGRILLLIGNLRFLAIR